VVCIHLSHIHTAVCIHLYHTHLSHIHTAVCIHLSHTHLSHIHTAVCKALPSRFSLDSLVASALSHLCDTASQTALHCAVLTALSPSVASALSLHCRQVSHLCDLAAHLRWQSHVAKCRVFVTAISLHTFLDGYTELYGYCSPLQGLYVCHKDMCTKTCTKTLQGLYYTCLCASLCTHVFVADGTTVIGDLCQSRWMSPRVIGLMDRDT